MAELVINLIVCALIFFIGVSIKYFKAYNLIAGYNTAPREVKEQIDAKALGDFIGRQLMIAAFTPLLGYGLKQAGFAWGTEVGIGLFLIIIYNTVIKARKITPQLSAYSSSKKSILIALAIVISVAVGITWTALPPAFELGNEQFTVSGAYGVSIHYQDIKEINLADKIPPLSLRTNGLGLGPILKGHFKLEDKNKALLFLRSANGPVLIIKRQSKPEIIMINCKDAAETRFLYHSLNEKINSGEHKNSDEQNMGTGTSDVAADPNQPTQNLHAISIDDFEYPPDYPKLEIRSDHRQLSWVKGDSNFTGEPGGIIGNTMFGMNEEHTDLLEPNIVKPESELVFAAAAIPGLNNPEYELYLLDENNSPAIYPLNKNTMLAPKEDGEYVFILRADWGNGDNSIDYWFKLRVNG